MKRTQLIKEYITPEVMCIKLHIDCTILVGSFTHEDIGDETDISDKFGFTSNF